MNSNNQGQSDYQQEESNQSTMPSQKDHQHSSNFVTRQQFQEVLERIQKVQKNVEKIEKAVEKIEKKVTKNENAIEKIEKAVEKIEKAVEKIDKIEMIVDYLWKKEEIVQQKKLTRFVQKEEKTLQKERISVTSRDAQRWDDEKFREEDQDSLMENEEVIYQEQESIQTVPPMKQVVIVIKVVHPQRLIQKPFYFELENQVKIDLDQDNKFVLPSQPHYFLKINSRKQRITRQQLLLETKKLSRDIIFFVQTKITKYWVKKFHNFFYFSFKVKKIILFDQPSPAGKNKMEIKINNQQIVKQFLIDEHGNLNFVDEIKIITFATKEISDLIEVKLSNKNNQKQIGSFSLYGWKLLLMPSPCIFQYIFFKKRKVGLLLFEITHLPEIVAFD